MATIEHDLLPQRDTDNDLEAEVLASETEEALFHQEMMEMQNSMEGLVEQSPLDDPLIEAELEKKRTLEKLLLFKRPLCKEVKIDGIRFKLKLLNSNENNKVLKEIMQLSGEEQISKSNLLLLAASLIEANGIKVEETYTGPIEITDPMLQRYYELSQWHAPVVNLLTRAYQDFLTEVEEGFSKDFLDKSSENPTTD